VIGRGDSRARIQLRGKEAPVAAYSLFA